MPRSVPRACLLVLPLLAVLVSACGTPEDTNVTVIGPSLADGFVPVTETINGTLVFGGTNFHTFHTMPGPVKVTLASVDPADAPVISLAIGMWDGISCQIVFEQPVGVAGTLVTGTSSIDSNVCVKVWDPNTLAADASVKYQLSVVHNEKPTT
jgi:hypothetical protein